MIRLEPRPSGNWETYSPDKKVQWNAEIRTSSVIKSFGFRKRSKSELNSFGFRSFRFRHSTVLYVYEMNNIKETIKRWLKKSTVF